MCLISLLLDGYSRFDVSVRFLAVKHSLKCCYNYDVVQSVKPRSNNVFPKLRGNGAEFCR